MAVRIYEEGNQVIIDDGTVTRGYNPTDVTWWIEGSKVYFVILLKTPVSETVTALENETTTIGTEAQVIAYLGSILGEKKSALGNEDDTPATDDTGTWSLIALFKRHLQRWTTFLSLLPTSLGQKSRANSFAVTLSSEDVTALTPSSPITNYAQETGGNLATIKTNTDKIVGTWGYNSGISGTLALTGSKRVLQITAIAEEAAASLTINGGDTITLPYGTTDKVSSEITIEPKGNLTDPTIIFTGTKAYFVEYVS